jgi:hypothetical protein
MILAAPCPAQGSDSWQLSLQSGVILRNVQLLALNGDDLQIRSGDSTGTLPLGQLSELRRVQSANDPDTTIARRPRGMALPETDELYQFVPYDLSEKRRIVQQILSGQSPNARPPR